MRTSTTFSAGLLSTMLGGAALGQTNNIPDLERETQIITCMEEALDAVDISDARNYYDTDDRGIKKYHENETTLIGVTTYLNPYGENIDTIEDAVHFQAKFYHEDETIALDSFRALTFRFTQNNGIHHIDHGHAMSYSPDNFISDFDSPPREISAQERESLNWANDAVNTMALQFTICMNFEPYEVGGWANTERPIQPPQWPDFLYTPEEPAP